MVLAAAPGAPAKNQNETRLDVTLAPSLFAPSRAVGDATHTARRFRTDFEIEVEDLDPGFYDAFVGGQFVGQLSVVQVPGGTEGVLRFSTRPTAGTLNLSFDPRGKAIEVRAGVTVFLSGTLSVTPNPEAPGDGASFSEYRDFVTAAAPGFGPRPRGTLRILSGRRRAWMRFELQRLADGPHTITANDVAIAQFTPFARGIARVRFSTNPRRGDLLLDFDPADTTFHVMRGGQAVLEFVTKPGTIGGGAEPIGQAGVSFTSTGVEPGAHGSATLRERSSRFDFSVEIGDLTPGPYALRVGGATRGTIHVSLSSDATRGLLEFSTQSGQPGKLPLTFDPRGQTIQIVRGEIVFLSLTFPN